MNVAIVDDHTLFREGLKLLLEDLGTGIRFVEVENCEQLVTAETQPLDLILLDFHLPGLSGIEALEGVNRRYEAVPVVVLSSEDSPRMIRSIIDAGAAGFVPKSSTTDVLMAALRLIIAGGTYLPPHVLRGISAEQISEPSPNNIVSLDSGESLSNRQQQVLLRAVKGAPNKIIAREMNISEATVKAHLSKAYKVLGVRNRTEAVFVAAERGLGERQLPSF